MKCPCCKNEKIIFRLAPEPHYVCKLCFHRWKQTFRAADYYKRLSGRSRMLERDLCRKNKERYKFLEKFLYKGMRVLEVGCAEGNFGDIIKHNLPVVYCGVEPSQDSKIATTKFDKVWSSVKQMPLNAQFDAILAFHVLEHIHNVGDAVSELYKSLKRNGLFIAEVPDFSGNKILPWDFNKEHIHLFRASSISLLFTRAKMDILELGSGYYESAIYNNSIRIVARKNEKKHLVRNLLRERLRRLLGERYVIFGIGGDFEGLVKPYIRTENVIGVIDSDKDKIGKRILKRTIQGPEVLSRYRREKILISTYRYSGEILNFLIGKGIVKSRIVTLEDIYES